MIIGKFSNLLDKQCSISFTSNYRIFDISRKFGIAAPAIMLMNGTEPMIHFYIEKGAEKYREVKIFLDSLETKDILGNWVVSSRSDRYEELNAVSDVTKVPSVILDTIYLRNGYLNVSFRFHSRFINEISAVLGKYMRRFSNLNISKLGPAQSLMDILRETSLYVPLSLVGTLNVNRETAEDNPLGSKWIRELKFTSADGLIHAVYKCENPQDVDKNKVTEISEKDGIYEAVTRSDLVSFYAEKTNGDLISSFSRTHECDGKRMIANSVFPSSYVRNYLEIINQARTKFDKIEITLLEVFDFPDSLPVREP